MVSVQACILIVTKEQSIVKWAARFLVIWVSIAPAFLCFFDFHHNQRLAVPLDNAQLGSCVNYKSENQVFGVSLFLNKENEKNANAGPHKIMLGPQ